MKMGAGVIGGAAGLVGLSTGALLFGALKVGGILVTQTSTIPSSIIAILEGFVMLFVVLSYWLQHRIAAARARRRASEGGDSL